MHGNLQSAVMLCYAKMFNIPLRDVMRHVVMSKFLQEISWLFFLFLLWSFFIQSRDNAFASKKFPSRAKYVQRATTHCPLFNHEHRTQDHCLWSCPARDQLMPFPPRKPDCPLQSRLGWPLGNNSLPDQQILQVFETVCDKILAACWTWCQSMELSSGSAASSWVISLALSRRTSSSTTSTTWLSIKWHYAGGNKGWPSIKWDYTGRNKDWPSIKWHRILLQICTSECSMRHVKTATGSFRNILFSEVSGLQLGTSLKSGSAAV